MQNEVIVALPIGQKANSPALRNFLIQRVIYTFAPTDNPETFEALDADTGALPQALAFNERIFWIDPNDSTSAHDGVAVIRTADDYRYKVNAVDTRTLSVLNFTTTTPPVSPSLGDAYLVPAGAVGAWSSHQDDIATWGRNGWSFEIPRIGRWLLDETVKGYLSYGPTGWSYGPGARSFAASIIPLSAAINFGRRIIVENRTTTSPPGSAAPGVAYLIANSATGAWMGQDGKIAICEVANNFTIYNPSNGWLVYDKTSSTEYRHNGAAWISASGSWIDRKSTGLTVSGTTTAPSGTTYYTYSSGAAPTTSIRRLIDGVTLPFAAKKTGAKLRLHYSADVIYTVAGGIGSPDVVIAVFQDAATNAIAWQQIPAVKALASVAASSIPTHLDHWFEFDAADNLSHTYSIALTCIGNLDAGTLTRRTLEVEEAA